MGKTVEFFTNGELGKPLDGPADYSLDAEMGLRYKVTEWASLNLKAERDIISGDSDSSLSKTRYTAGFGVFEAIKQRNIHLTFVLSAVMMGVLDRIAFASHRDPGGEGHH